MILKVFKTNDLPCGSALLKGRNIVQRVVIKIIPKKKKFKKAKWLSEEALQIAVKKREMKSKGEKYIPI